MRLRIAAIVVLVASWARLWAQNPTFSSKVEAVRVDVLVTRDGQPLQGLTASDFEIIDSGVPQRVDLATFELIPLNVVLAFDMSVSVTGWPLGNLRDAAGALLDGLSSQDRAALISFSHVVTERSGLTGNLTRVRSALAGTEPYGETALVDGTYTAMMLGQSDPGRGLLIVFSDGLDTASWLAAATVLDAAKRSDVVTYAVSTDSAKGPLFLQALCDLTGGRLYRNESTANLKSIFLRVLEEFRHRYLLTYSPEGVAATGWHRLEVRVKGRNASVKARPGYLRGS